MKYEGICIGGPLNGHGRSCAGPRMRVPVLDPLPDDFETTHIRSVSASRTQDYLWFELPDGRGIWMVDSPQGREAATEVLLRGALQSERMYLRRSTLRGLRELGLNNMNHRVTTGGGSTLMDVQIEEIDG